MFITQEDIGTQIYDYQVEQISEGNDSILLMAINAAIQEVQSYLTPNDRKEYQDGRPRYDAESIFATTGENRNPLLVQITCTVAKFHFIELCNADVLYERAKASYDRAIDYLKNLASGKVTLSSLPLLMQETSTSEQNERLPYRAGSRTKFNHE